MQERDQQDIKIESVDCELLSELQNKLFVLKERKARRRTRLDQLLPCGSDYRYCSVMSNCSVSLSNGRFAEYSDYRQLFKHFMMENRPESLSQVMREGGLIEGRLRIPKTIARLLNSYLRGSESLFVKCWLNPEVTCWRIPQIPFLKSDDLLDFLPQPFGEFEGFDKSGKVFLRFSDDSPFILLASNKGLVKRLVAEAPSLAMILPAEFEL